VVGLDAPPAFAAVSDLAFKFLIEASEGDDRRPPAPSPAPAEPAVPLDDLDAVQLLTRKTDLETQRLQIRKALADGEVVLVADLLDDAARRFHATRTSILAIASRVAPQMKFATPDEARRLLAGQVTEALDHLRERRR
jgi:hypothetical protein